MVIAFFRHRHVCRGDSFFFDLFMDVRELMRDAPCFGRINRVLEFRIVNF